MNKKGTEWSTRTWNPVTGCLHGCSYCYAVKQARRFSGTDGTGADGLLELSERREKTYPAGFMPTFHKYRLNKPQKEKTPQNIFVGSMCDLFGDWVPDEWIEEVFKSCEVAPWHRYLFLTKNPIRYFDLDIKGKLPDSDKFWYGVTITSEKTIRQALAFGDLKVKHSTFISAEPLHGDITATKEWQEIMYNGAWVKWVIIGAETGNSKDKVIPEREWIESIIETCRENEIPIFMKDSLSDIWGEPLIQEFPW